MPWNGATQMLFGQVDKKCSRHGFRSPDLEDSYTHRAVKDLPAARSEPHHPLHKKCRVGELRPSQILFTYGIGAFIDLPHISTMVMGLDDWETTHTSEIGEARLLQAVRSILGPQVKWLRSLPAILEQLEGGLSPFDESATVGIPVAPFPRWMLCPRCRRLASLDSGLFQLKADVYRPDRIRYVHSNCSKAVTSPVLPARFLVACEHGHLDDFPWVPFVHKGEQSCRARLRLREVGVSGEAAGIEVECEVCGAKRRMSDAFGSTAEGQKGLPPCNGRRPHLRDYEEEVCEQSSRTISLGASNSWFPIVLSTLAVPIVTDRLGQCVEEYRMMDQWPGSCSTPRPPIVKEL